MEAAREISKIETLDFTMNSVESAVSEKQYAEKCHYGPSSSGGLAGSPDRERSSLISFSKKSVPAVKRFILWHPREIRISEWLQYTD